MKLWQVIYEIKVFRSSYFIRMVSELYGFECYKWRPEKGVTVGTI